MVLNGTDLLLYIDDGNGEKAQAYASSHSVSISSEVRDTSSKESGDWGDSATGRLSWSASADGLVAADEVDKDVYETLYDAMVAKTTVTLCSARRDPADIDTKLDAKVIYTGESIIESLEQSASDNDNVTYSVSFSGKGAWTKSTHAAA